MKHEVKAISLTCDGCGQTFETLDGMACYADDEDGKLVEETACNSDWKIMNGHHYCASCWERDDDDIIHTKDGKRWDDSSIEVVEVREEEIVIKKAEGLASDSENEVAIREFENERRITEESQSFCATDTSSRRSSRSAQATAGDMLLWRQGF